MPLFSHVAVFSNVLRGSSADSTMSFTALGGSKPSFSARSHLSSLVRPVHGPYLLVRSKTNSCLSVHSSICCARSFCAGLERLLFCFLTKVASAFPPLFCLKTSDILADMAHSLCCTDLVQRSSRSTDQCPAHQPAWHKGSREWLASLSARKVSHGGGWCKTRKTAAKCMCCRHQNFKGAWHLITNWSAP